MIIQERNSRRLRHRRYLLILPICLAFFTSCGSMRETFPERSATEQLLMSTAADRALEKLPTQAFSGKTMYVSGYHLDGYDNDYVILGLRRHLLQHGAHLVNVSADSELTLEVATGGLSVDYRSGLIGIPSIPIPIPFAGNSFNTPELALFKNVQHSGLAKITLTCFETKTGKNFLTIPILRGKAIMRERWYLLVGPFRTSNLHKEFE